MSEPAKIADSDEGTDPSEESDKKFTTKKENNQYLFYIFARIYKSTKNMCS